MTRGTFLLLWFASLSCAVLSVVVFANISLVAVFGDRLAQTGKAVLYILPLFVIWMSLFGFWFVGLRARLRARNRPAWFAYLPGLIGLIGPMVIAYIELRTISLAGSINGAPFLTKHLFVHILLFAPMFMGAVFGTVLSIDCLLSNAQKKDDPEVFS